MQRSSPVVTVASNSRTKTEELTICECALTCISSSSVHFNSKHLSNKHRHKPSNTHVSTLSTTLHYLHTVLGST